MTLLFQQDDCAPDSYEYFCKNFKAEVGVEFNDWKAGKTNTSNDPEQVILEDESYKVKCSGDSPYWKVFKK